MRAGCGAGGLAALVLAGSVALAQDDPPAALGRIAPGSALRPGAAICTGALVAPDLVLTAAHCLTGALADPGALRFEAAWRGGRPRVARRGAEVILAGRPAGPPPDGLAGLAADLALLRLADPVPAAAARPLPLADPQAPLPAALALAAFRRDAPETPDPRRICLRLALPAGAAPGLVALDCAVVSGHSGAPLVTQDAAGGGARLVAVVVAAGRPADRVRAWAARPPPDLLRRIGASAD